MKTNSMLVLWALICLFPTILVGQSIQEETLLLKKGNSLRTLQRNSMQNMTGSPLLRVSNIGSSGQDGVSIELNSLSIMDPGPTVLFDCPDPTIPGSGALRLMANPGEAFIRIDNIGSSGQDGVRMVFAHPPVHNAFFDVFVDLGLMRESHRLGHIGDPDFDLLVIRDYEIDTPRILERIETSIGPWADHFFDITYDLDLGAIGKGFGNNPDNICAITMFDPMTPSVHERIQASGDDSFFDVWVDLNARSETHKVGIMGDPDFDLLRIQSYEIDTPRILERIETTIGPWTERFFDIEYDLDLGTIGKGFGNNPDNICMITKYDPIGPSIHERIQASSDDSFFDVFVDLNARSETRKVGIMGDPDFDLLRIQSYEIDTPRVRERIETTIEPWINSAFDIVHDLDKKTQKVQMQDMHITRTFDTATPSLHEHVFSGNPLADGTFGLTLDLSLGRETRRFNHLPGDPDFDLLVIREYDRATPKLTESILSTNPSTNSYAETVDMSVMSLSNVFTDDDNDNMHHGWTYDPNGPAGTMVLASNSSASSFFTSYDLSLKTETHSFVDGATEVKEQATYIEPILEKKITYSGPEPPFIIHHDLLAGIQGVSHGDLMCTETFNYPSRQYVQLISFDQPTTPGSIQTIYDISQANLLKHSTLALPGLGMQPIEVHTEYDRLTHTIRERSQEPGIGILTIERRLQTPFGPTLGIGGSITIGNGGAIRTDVGPLLMAGNVVVNGDLNVTGMKAFKIDHPLDPDNKYLIHSCIESPDMMNIYNGNIITDENGYATINLPEYFEALNSDFRYQLTCMGQFAQAIVDQKVHDNKFVIRTDKPNVEVSWQVTGIRHDPASKRGSYAVEIYKEPEMKGKRLYHQ